MTLHWCQSYLDGTLLYIKVQPGASRNEVQGIYTDPSGQSYLKIKLIQIAEDGKANKALFKLLSSYCHIPVSKLEIIGGEISHFKRIFLPCCVTQVIQEFEKAIHLEK